MKPKDDIILHFALIALLLLTMIAKADRLAGMMTGAANAVVSRVSR